METICVTGCCGTVGGALVKSLISERSHDARVIGIDNNESQLFFLTEKYKDMSSDSQFLYADIRDFEALQTVFQGVDVVYHAAALKHVGICETSPFEAVQTNIHGVQNVIKAARGSSVKQVVFTSSDKAVNPTSVMGTSKLMGERLISAANELKATDGIRFSSTRFGNVLGSNGSVIQIFQEQIRSGKPITLTDSGMTRFIMTIDQAAELVIESSKIAIGGEVLITKMPVVAIHDLAEAMIELLAPELGIEVKDIEIKIIGQKAGEKLYEELLSEEEMRRAVELPEYFSVLPAFKDPGDYDYLADTIGQVNRPYNSRVESKLTKDEIKKFLTVNDVL